MRKGKQIDLEELIENEELLRIPKPQELYLNSRGHEQPDPTPMAPPIGYKQQPSLFEQVRQMVRSEKLRMEAEQAGMETFEESEDFDVGDDFDPQSPWENEFDPSLSEIQREVEQHRRANPDPSSTAKPTEGKQVPPSNPPSDGPGAPTPPKSSDAKPS